MNAEYSFFSTMWSPLQSGSSPVDWCEGNYLISSNIAEFVNTVSNILFFLFPPVLMHLFKEYGRVVNPAIHMIWILLIFVGGCSAYFHATLSLIGQLLDEVAILWLFMSAFCLFFPRRYFPDFLQNNRIFLSLTVFFPSLLATGLSIINPVINAFALMTLGLPTIALLMYELQRVKCQRVYRLGVRCALVWVLAVVCWVNDRLWCDAWSSINFPYLHGFWHIFIFIASYTACVLFAYFSVKEEMPQRKPVLRYWPKNDFEFGIPYVSINCYDKFDTEHDI